MKIVKAIFLMLLVSFTSFGQKFTILDGDFKFLENQKKINVVFKYDNLKLLKENKSESEYVAERKDELNKKTPGVGDTWQKKWESSKESMWETNFMDLLAKTATSKKGIVFGENLKDAKYTLVVNAVWIYPGWDAGVMKQHAKVTTELVFAETANPAGVVLKIKSENAPGDQWGSNFSNESRIGEGFEKTAKTLGNRIVKEL